MKVWRRIEPLLKRLNVDYRVEFSESPTHAANIARQLAANDGGKTVLVVVGGDGTLQSVIPELVGSPVPVGVIPAGSGNDFARALGIPLHPEKALDSLLTGQIRKMDIARTGDRFCVTVVGIGIDGKVAQTVNESRYKKWFHVFNMGRFSYVLGLFQVWVRYRPNRVTLFIDGTETTYADVWLVAVANVPSYGGGMNICPNASYADGAFDICVVHGISRFKFLRTFPKVFKGTHIHVSGVTMLKGKEVKVVSDSPMFAHGDGEMIGQTPIGISVCNEAIHVVSNNTTRTPF